jgi:hypothetical protein
VAHAVVAPPEGSIKNEREFYEGKSKAADIAKEKGFRGFAIIAHPCRVNEQTKIEYRDRDPDVGLWVWLRNEFTEQELRDRIYWSPHYHIVGATSADMEPGDESDEWVYEFIRSVESYDGIRDRDSHESVYRVFRYLLSHIGFPEGSTKQAVTWYGDLANSVFVEDATEDWQTEKPSEGVRSAIKREVEAVAGPVEEDDEDGAQSDESDDMGDCPRDDCSGVLIDVFDIRMYLDHNDPPPDVARRMQTAYEWRLGERLPPPGMKHPRTEEEAREAFQALL